MRCNNPVIPGFYPAPRICRNGADYDLDRSARKIDGFDGIGPEGICEDDVGQMSAWFILAASGLHQSCPGDLRFEIFTPLLDKITVKRDLKDTKGDTFIVALKNNSQDNVNIQSAGLDDKPLNRCWLGYPEISTGRTLELILGPKPNKLWVPPSENP